MLLLFPFSSLSPFPSSLLLSSLPTYVVVGGVIFIVIPNVCRRYNSHGDLIFRHTCDVWPYWIEWEVVAKSRRWSNVSGKLANSNGVVGTPYCSRR